MNVNDGVLAQCYNVELLTRLCWSSMPSHKKLTFFRYTTRENLEGFSFKTLHVGFLWRLAECLSLAAYLKKKEKEKKSSFCGEDITLSSNFHQCRLGACAASQDTGKELSTDSPYHLSMLLSSCFHLASIAFVFLFFFFKPVDVIL